MANTRWSRGAAALLAVSTLLVPQTMRAQAVRGDLDRDQSIALTDAIVLLGYVFLGSPRPACDPVIDANGDAAVDVSDAVRIIVFLFGGAPPLPALDAGEQAACETPNEPPSVPAPPVYRTYPGFPLELAIGASDPEGDALRYEAADLPPGASLDESLGVLRWTPAPDQLGAFHVACAVSDSAAPPNRVTSVLVFLVLPPDPCVQPRCDPTSGCEADLLPLGQSCCAGGPAARVEEPDVDCPAGRVLHVGRNSSQASTIGRLQSCDLLRLVPLGQGGHVATLHLETRCLRPEGVIIEIRLQTGASVLIDASPLRDLTPRTDGYLQVRNLQFIAEGFFAEGMEANLTVAVTDLDGVRVERQVRVRLTREPVADLP